MRSTGLYSTYENLSQNLPTGKPLVTLEFDHLCRNLLDQGVVSTGLKILSPAPCREFWVGELPFKQVDLTDVWVQATEDWLFAAVWIDESQHASLESATESAYSTLLSTTQTLGFPHWVRVWNYLERINEAESGLERYRHFCVGRYKAFKAFGLDETQFPSACALGHAGGGLLVYLLANKQQPKHFENPVQVSAYEYPVEYGPKSPSFARATLAANGDAFSLYLSGTASVVGHATQAPFQLLPQIQTTLQNIDRILQHVAISSAEFTQIPKPKLQLEVLKVYVRHPNDLSVIKRHVDEHFQSNAILYVQADICRADLLLEIDGVWRLTE